MSRRWGLGLIAAVAVIISVIACRQLVGITDNPPTDLTSTLCGLPYGTSACASCVQASCCAESTTCAADPACAAYQTCLGKCNGDPGCRSRCIGDNPVGTSSDVSALSVCLASNCETACGLTCGSVAAYIAPPDAGASCEACLQSNGACDPARACGSSVDCDAYIQCLLACPTPDCREACASNHDAGASVFGIVEQVISGTCSAPCAFGRSWSCVGRVSWPVAHLQTVDMTVEVANLPSVTPVPDADVTVSDYCPPSVSGTLQHGVTGSSGTVLLEVPQVTVGGAGSGHGLEGCILATSPGFLPTFWYWGFPLTAPAVTWTQLGTPSVPSSGFDVPMLSQATVMELGAALVGVALDPTRGIVSVTVFDCAGALAPGVSVTTGLDDAGVTAAYGLVPSVTMKATGTDGIVTFVNVPTGSLTLTAMPTALGLPSSQITVNVAASTLTEVLMYPTPNP